MPRPNKFHPFIAIVFLLFGLSFFGMGIVIQEGNVQFEDGSLRTTGVVVARAIDDERSLYPGDVDSHHRVHYRFTDTTGTEHKGDMYVSDELYERSLPGELVAVLYLPSDPRTNRLYLEDDRAAALIFRGIGGLMMLVGVLFGYRSVQARLFNRRLSREGVVTEGVVAGILPTNVTLREVPQVLVAFSFRTFEGQSLTGYSDYMTSEPPPPFKPGDKVRVRYLREHPEFNRLEESPH